MDDCIHMLRRHLPDLLGQLMGTKLYEGIGIGIGS